jgi:hypothetical protein
MPRIHLHVVVEDLAVGIRFYSLLLGSKPTLEKEDYAEWELASPPVNLDITTRGKVPGLDHVGIQFETDAELAGVQPSGQSAVAMSNPTNTGCWILLTSAGNCFTPCNRSNASAMTTRPGAAAAGHMLPEAAAGPATSRRSTAPVKQPGDG